MRAGADCSPKSVRRRTPRRCGESTLERWERAALAPHQPFSHHGPLSSAAERVDRARVLVVDDEPDIRECICEVLELEGYEALSAEDGKQGLEALERERPRLVLLDVSMPTMDGHEFMHALKGRPELGEIPVVIMTAGKSQPEGARAFIQKPCEVSTLLRCVAQLVGEPC